MLWTNLDGKEPPCWLGLLSYCFYWSCYASPAFLWPHQLSRCYERVPIQASLPPPSPKMRSQITSHPRGRCWEVSYRLLRRYLRWSTHGWSCVPWRSFLLLAGKIHRWWWVQRSFWRFWVIAHRGCQVAPSWAFGRSCGWIWAPEGGAIFYCSVWLRC